MLAEEVRYVVLPVGVVPRLSEGYCEDEKTKGKEAGRSAGFEKRTSEREVEKD